MATELLTYDRMIIEVLFYGICIMYTKIVLCSFYLWINIGPATSYATNFGLNKFPKRHADLNLLCLFYYFG